jgi:hypothetical protein
MLVPPDTLRMMGLLPTGSMAARKTPLVQKSASQYSIIGLMVSPGFSSLLVGPRKYPWSIGINMHLPSDPISDDNRFFIPQSISYTSSA